MFDAGAWVSTRGYAIRRTCLRTSSNLVSVTSKLSGGRNGINPTGLDDTTRHSPECMRGCEEGSRQQSQSRKVTGIHIGSLSRECKVLSRKERFEN